MFLFHLFFFTVEEVRNNRPVVGSLVQPLLTNASWLVGIGEKLELNVQALRRKIELAQEQANRVRFQTVHIYHLHVKG